MSYATALDGADRSDVSSGTSRDLFLAFAVRHCGSFARPISSVIATYNFIMGNKTIMGPPCTLLRWLFEGKT